MAEANSQRFRTAVGGFHKGDVSAYITKIAGEHRAETEELRQQLEALQKENDTLRTQMAQAEAQLEKALDGVHTEDGAAAHTEEAITSESITDLELGAYRRAEAAERLAHQRAKRLYEDMQGIYDNSAAQLRTISGATGKALGVIEEAMLAIKTALMDTQDTAKKAQKALEDMGALVPDPAEGLEAEP